VSGVPDDLEVYCPECGRLFKGQGKMIRHLEKDHLAKRENSKELVLALDSRYLGGHPSFTGQSDGVLSLYKSPVNKVVFQADDFTFDVPITRITEIKVAEGKEIDAMRALLLGLASPLVGAASLIWQKKNKIFYIQFQDQLNKKQTVVFDHSDSMDEFAQEVKSRLPEIKETNIQKTSVTQSSVLDNREDPLQIIKVRFAKGELTKEQYADMKRILTS
jgi:uncharacterized C2H2 Zn-finger protein